MHAADFHALRRYAQIESGRIAYIEQGSGPAALFIHGVPLNGIHWRFVIEQLQGLRRCIAPDLMGLGYTEVAAAQDVSVTAQASMLVRFIDSLGLDRVDVVGNDTGGAVAQIFAAHNPGRVRTLTLTNCDVHDNWPPPQIARPIALARAGKLIDDFARFVDDPIARSTRFARAYVDPSVLTDEVFRAYIEPLRATQQKRDSFHAYWLALDHRHTVAIEPLLRKLHVPVLIVWALEDVFFDVTWADWLRAILPGVTRLVEVPDAKLFFPEDRPEALIGPLCAFWSER